MLENCIFYISPMYEFSHSQGQTRSFAMSASMSDLPESGRSRAIFAGGSLGLRPGRCRAVIRLSRDVAAQRRAARQRWRERQQRLQGAKLAAERDDAAGDDIAA